MAGTLKLDEIKSEIRSYLLQDPFYSESVPRSFDDQFQLLESGAIDSLGIFNLIVFLETRFNIQIGIEELSDANFSNLDSIGHLIHSKF